jgi:uncharacterized protein YjiS (DUF1127 family)
LIVRAQPRPAAEGSRLIEAIDLILLWIERARQRAQLAGIEPHALHDLGLSRADLDAECRKRFWQR